MKATLTDEEIRNNILAEIHNRLAEISTYLKMGLAVFAKLDHNEAEMLKNMAQNIDIVSQHKAQNYSYYEPQRLVGFTKNDGLYLLEPETLDIFPLGDFERTVPIDEVTGAFINNSQEA